MSEVDSSDSQWPKVAEFSVSSSSQWQGPKEVATVLPQEKPQVVIRFC